MDIIVFLLVCGCAWVSLVSCGFGVTVEGLGILWMKVVLILVAIFPIRMRVCC